MMYGAFLRLEYRLGVNDNPLGVNDNPLSVNDILNS